MNRALDIFLSLVTFILLLPLFVLIGLIIIIDSSGGAFYKQSRVGKNNRDFYILKFRTMFQNSDQQGLITTGSSDKRVTKAGRFLRKYKLDEFPQLINILAGDMSIVGPRPEVRKYVNLYDQQQMKVLSVRPGLTDYASLVYYQEGELLASHSDPEKVYREEIMPAKLALNLKYIEEKSLWTDLIIIGKTIRRIFSNR